MVFVYIYENLNLMKRTILGILALISICITAEFAYTYSNSAPPAGYANDPGAANCTACHTSFALATSGSTWNNITLTSSVPLSQFLPNQLYTLTLSFSDASSTKYGFEMVALPAPATASSASIGSFTATDATTEVNTSGTREYISHSAVGTSAPLSTKTWTFDWTTPTSFTGNVSFYVVVNSTNGDGTNSGDRVYAKVFSSTVLPVKWLSYEVKTEAAGNRIKWITASEINNDHFEVEESADGTTWQSIAKIKGKGNSNRQTAYEYFDAGQTGAQTYYRIKQVDADGKLDYSKVLISGQLYAVTAEQVAYNPLTNMISISNPSQMAPATLFNLSGMPVCEDPAGENLDVSVVEKGIYLLKLPSGAFRKIYIY